METHKKTLNFENVANDLIHYYEVRMSALSDFSTRTWHRFNWFLTVQLGAFAFIFSSMIKVPESEWYAIVCGFVALTALIWSLLGFEDFKHIEQYAGECKEIEAVYLDALADRVDIRFSYRHQNTNLDLLPFKHGRILYLFPLLAFTAWSGLSVYLFVQ